MSGKRRGRPSQATPGKRAALVRAVSHGATLREAAAAAGVHVATVCRWQARDTTLGRDIRAAAFQGWQMRAVMRDYKPSVPVRPDCPQCGSVVEVATANAPGGFRFWRCAGWPGCTWASWRPPAPGRCSGCYHGVLYWSHSRKTIGCAGCGRRWPARYVDILTAL